MTRGGEAAAFRVSAVIPCHNAGPWIGQALWSVAAQSVPVHETIVIDDDSSDDSVSRIEGSGVRLKLLRSSAHNAAATRNIGIEAATGDWIAFLDADDVWYPNHVRRAAELLSATAHVAFMANHDWISLQSALVPMPDPFVCRLSAPYKGNSVDDFCRLSKYGFHFGHSTVLYRRSRLLEAGLFDVTQRRRHDIDLWLRVIAGRTWVYDNVKSMGYRATTPGSLSQDELDCDYYELLALSKNAAQIDSRLLRQYLTRQARRAMGVAFVDGSPEHYARIRELAWPHLLPFYKIFYALGSARPSILRSAIKAKRDVNRWLRHSKPALTEGQ